MENHRIRPEQGDMENLLGLREVEAIQAELEALRRVSEAECHTRTQTSPFSRSGDLQKRARVCMFAIRKSVAPFRTTVLKECFMKPALVLYKNWKN